ncbi:MAG: hypothetical protein HZB55_22340 [Deltaproteobacteria bacterium]|nr:hypothetical protein [Deltaproteobacteria bacterium]
MSDLPIPICPSENDADPVVRWINRAIAKAQTDLAAKKDPRAKDPFYILAYALQIIIKTRELPGGANGVQSLPKPNCNDINLAYADHYLQMRTEAFNLGPRARHFMEDRVLEYEKEKVSKAASGQTASMKTGICAPSPATNQSLYWALKGIEDGLTDYKAHPRSAPILEYLPRHIAW